MKKHILPLLIILLTLMTSCSSVLEVGYICILNAENGKISVTREKGSKPGSYIITATPDEGYFITDQDVKVVVDSRNTYERIINVTKVDTNKFQFQTNDGYSVTVSAVFRKIVE